MVMGKKEKVSVRICVGTACFVQGGADLLLYQDFLDPVVLAGCDIQGISCIGGCKDDSMEVRPPYVEIDGKVFGEMTQEKLCKALLEVVHA